MIAGIDIYRTKIAKLFEQGSFPDNSANNLHQLLGGKKVLLYGAGDGFITFSVFVLRKYGIRAYAVLDKKFSAPGTHFGVPSFNPDSYVPTSDEKGNSVVVITVGRAEYHEEIIKDLRMLGFRNIVLAQDIYEYHLHYSPYELEKKGFDYYLENKDRIMACLELFADEISCDIYTCVLQTHMNRKPIVIPNHPIEDQYFPVDIHLSKGYSRVINCGAYTGDTVMQLNKRFGKIEALACFEPEPENFRLLSRYLCARHNEIAQSITAFPLGVFSHEQQFRFSSGDRINSSISDTGDTVIQCAAIDHVLPGFSPTFINMDVEGAEPEGLHGAETLIRDALPDLAVCVYHSPNHLWDIPLYLASLCPDYTFYLRNYTSFVAETVLYATMNKS